MNEPLSSLDPIDWLVFSDWLYDQGKDDESKRAKAIARGLEGTGGLLYLYYCYGKGGTKYISHVCRDRGSPLSLDISYNWTNEEEKEQKWATHCHKVSPVQFPSTYKDRQDVVALYWDKLAELGTER